MKKILAFICFFMVTSLVAQTKSMPLIDIEKSTIDWAGYKLVGKHTGTISFKEAELIFIDDKLVKGKFLVDMNSITCTDLKGESAEKLVEHLKSKDFFDVKEYPLAEINFIDINNIEGSSYEIKAALTIRGVRNIITFNADIRANHATAVLNIDRTDFKINYNSGKIFKDLGDHLIKDIFTLNINLVY